MNRENSRNRLMKELQTYSFAAHEALLYLDAYPESKEALAYYNKFKKLENQIKNEYEAKYGPVTSPNEAQSWQWNKGPWPWQLDGEVML
ncbi:MAG: spore coat protein CotJB [Clostridia bacterium]|nr:spore coat protein CotJB [Clostridia bacterium]